MSDSKIPLLIGEIFVDVTILPAGVENKMRLGGIVHAARAFWATDTPYAVAAFLPDYLEDSARDYLARFGCQEFIKLGEVTGAPNVILIFDGTEVDDQGYEILLRDEKRVAPLQSVTAEVFNDFDVALAFPGSYDLTKAVSLLPEKALVILDVAYDVETLTSLNDLPRKIDTLIFSTSSQLFQQEFDEDFEKFVGKFSHIAPNAIILKENRGGCRAFLTGDSATINVPAFLGETVNSVGVGDAFDAAYLSQLPSGRTEALWRGAQVASCYAKTTEPDVFKEYVRRELRLSLEELEALSGTFLPWEARPHREIYLAAPDFSYVSRVAIDRALSALTYHNFRTRRPVQENGELPPGSDWSELISTYHKDVSLLEQCDLVFAIPIGKDPGTLVEIGIAITRNIPVVVYDPNSECLNTMVMAGAKVYSRSLDACLTATFDILSQQRVRQE